ncbi:MAG: N-acetyltransferase family protein [Ramlibacter sp.]
MRIEPAADTDCAALARVHVASWQHAYRHLLPADYLDALSVEKREAGWREVLARGGSQLLVARAAGEVLGFASFGKCRDGDAPAGRGELWALYASPQAWSRGVGRALWGAARAQLDALGFRDTSLWVLAGNARAIRFYTAAGFVAEPGSAKDVQLGGVTLREVRYIGRQGPTTAGATP